MCRHDHFLGGFFSAFMYICIRHSIVVTNSLGMKDGFCNYIFKIITNCKNAIKHYFKLQMYWNTVYYIAGGVSSD